MVGIISFLLISKFSVKLSKFSVILISEESKAAIICHKLNSSLNFLSYCKIHTPFCDPVFHTMSRKLAELRKGYSPPFSSIIGPPGNGNRHLDQTTTGPG